MWGSPGYSGNAVWGSSPAIDNVRNHVYVTTGNNYTAPVAYHECVEAATTDAERAACNADDNYFDSIVALDKKTGEVKPNGLLALEIGWRQANDVSALLEEAGFLRLCVAQDLGGRDRCLLARAGRRYPAAAGLRKQLRLRRIRRGA